MLDIFLQKIFEKEIPTLHAMKLNDLNYKF